MVVFLAFFHLFWNTDTTLIRAYLCYYIAAKQIASSPWTDAPPLNVCKKEKNTMMFSEDYSLHSHGLISAA